MKKKRKLKEKQMKRKKWKRVLRVLVCSNLSFILSVTIAILAFLVVVRWSFFGKASFYFNLRENNYYELLQEEIIREAQTITISTGLPVEVLDDTIDLYQVNVDVNKYINDSFLGNDILINTINIEFKLNSNIENYFVSVAITPTKEQKENIKYYINEISNLYKDRIKVPLFDYYIYGRTFFLKIFRLGVIFCTVLLILMWYLLIKMNPWTHRTFRYIVYSFTAAALMIAFIPGILLYYKEYQKINVKPESFYKLMVSCITNVLETFLNFSFGLLVLVMILLLLIRYLRLSILKPLKE